MRVEDEQLISSHIFPPFWQAGTLDFDIVEYDLREDSFSSDMLPERSSRLSKAIKKYENFAKDFSHYQPTTMQQAVLVMPKSQKKKMDNFLQGFDRPVVGGDDPDDIDVPSPVRTYMRGNRWVWNFYPPDSSAPVDIVNGVWRYRP